MHLFQPRREKTTRQNFKSRGTSGKELLGAWSKKRDKTAPPSPGARARVCRAVPSGALRPELWGWSRHGPAFPTHFPPNLESAVGISLRILFIYF